MSVFTLFGLCNQTPCFAGGAGTVDAVYSFSASDFFVDPFQPYVYATSGSSLQVINSTTLAVEQTIALPAISYGMTMSADGSKLYIAGGSSQSIFVVDTHTWNLLPSVPASGSPYDLAMGLSNRLFVLGGGIYGIYQIDATTGASAGPNAPVFYPYSGALRISPDKTRLYYADFGLSPGSLYQMDVSTTNVTVLWSNPGDIGENGEQLALSDDGSMVAYVCGYGYHGYQIPNFSTPTMTLLGVFPTGAYPDCLAYSPDTRYAYALHTIYPTAVDIYDLSTYAMVGQFAVVDQAKVMTADQSGQHLFIAFDGEFYGHSEVRVYDTGRTASTSNQPPVCRIGGPYTAECRGAATVVQLNGSASSDPQGKPLTFMWSTSSPGTSFDNPASPTPKLMINADTTETCTVTLVISDGLLTNSAQTIVNVVDTTPPVITVASNKVVQCGSNWDFDLPTAFDACCGSNVTITIMANLTNASVSNVLESYTRIWAAKDCSGNTSTCSQTVTVVDTTPPAITVASNKVVQCGSNWDFDIPVAFDACCGTNVTIGILGTTTNASVSNALESFTRIWVATDCAGNTNTCSQTVTVVDTQPPVLSQVSATPTTLWPPDHKLVPVTISAVVTDSCDPAPTWWISSVASSDPAPATGDPDYQITGTNTVLLRAERKDANTPRTYQITVEATDASGNTTTQNVVVMVPGSAAN